MAMPEPTPPSSDEVKLYYHGIPNCPRLVARSSSHVWVNPQNPKAAMDWGHMGLTYSMYPKTLHTVGRHPLLHRLWNDATSSLRIQILEAIKGIDWTSVDFLRVGLNGEYQITLMVAARPDSLTWSHGHPVAVRCKSILEEHGIDDITCEILEAVVHFHADAESKYFSTIDSEVETDASPATLQLFSGPVSATDDSKSARMKDLTDRLGTNIATSRLNSVTSTKGLYVSIRPTCSGDEPQVVALTCRHLMIDPKTEGTQKYQKSQPFKEVIQVDQRTYVRHLWHIAAGSKNAWPLEDESESDGECGNESSEDRHTRAAALPVDINAHAMVLGRAMESFRDPSSRVFGRLLYSPEFTVAPDNSASTWLRDWALIELLPNSHQAALSSIQNIVYLGTECSILACMERNGEHYERRLLYPLQPLIKNGELKLQRVAVPMEEIFASPETEDVHEAGLLVGKYGAKGRLSFGLGNTLKSVVRHVETSEGGGETELISEEWAIISTTMDPFSYWQEDVRQECFARDGDYGSCIWDMQGRPAGILTAASGFQYDTVNHITYAQPLERLLKDIKSEGFDVELV
ncbi:hypothetical protein V8C34DRAFT_321498 [Trichoderma compactum]